MIKEKRSMHDHNNFQLSNLIGGKKVRNGGPPLMGID